MDDILAVIDAALRKKGLSDAAASKLAVGHPALLKNMRLPAEGEKRYNLAALKRLAEVLDIEFYFGTPRRKFGMAEPAPGGSDLDRAEALRAGFLPLPWHPVMMRRGTAPIAFARAWMEAQNLSPDPLAVVEPDDVAIDRPGEGPVLAVLDTEAPRRGAAAPWAFHLAGRVLLARAQFDARSAVLFGLGPDGSAKVLIGEEREALRILGRVIWLGLAVPAPL